MRREQALKLTDAQLKKRKVDWIKISEDKIDKKQYKKELDPAQYKCDVSSPPRGPFTAGWETRSPTPLMCAYKVVTYEFKYRLVGGMVEKFMEKFERDLFLRFHRELVCTMHEWMNLSMEDIRKIEDETAAKLREVRKQARTPRARAPARSRERARAGDPQGWCRPLGCGGCRCELVVRAEYGCARALCVGAGRSHACVAVRADVTDETAAELEAEVDERSEASNS